MKEYGDKLLVDKKEKIEKVVVDVCEVYKVEDLDCFDVVIEVLNVVW